jgi:hypothetical protein
MRRPIQYDYQFLTTDDETGPLEKRLEDIGRHLKF